MPTSSRLLVSVVSASVLALVVTACSGDEGEGEDGPTPQDAAEVLQANIDGVSRLVPVTEENDPNDDMLGRPNGYTAATVVVDSRGDCEDGTSLGVDCSATIEQWPSYEEARERSEYILGLQEDAPILGSEWNTVRGSLLLRVSGELDADAADEYQEIFESSDLEGKASRQP